MGVRGLNIEGEFLNFTGMDIYLEEKVVEKIY